MKIIIIGAGWYGLHSYLYLKNKYKNFNITILEKEITFFNNSSNYNQNRLHLGYHYPKSYKTRDLCKKGYYKFIKQYYETIDFIKNNYYLISNESILDYKTYLKIYSNDKNYNHTLINNNFFKNIEGEIINTKEQIINSNKVNNYFKKNMDFSKIFFGYEVKNIKILKSKKKIIINNNLICDIIIDCTYNKFNMIKNTIFELTISLVYIRFNFNDSFDSITIMDGDFFSLFPRNSSKKIYTLTHVKYTPLVKSFNIEDIYKYNLTYEKIMEIKNNMEKDVIKYYPNFHKNFKFKSYFTSYKCKINNNNNSRECYIQENDNIISVLCGKITGIYHLENYLNLFFDKYIKDEKRNNRI